MADEELTVKNGSPPSIDAWEFKPIACPVCGGDRPRVIGARGGAAHHSRKGVQTRIVRCTLCTHMYPNPMPYPLSINEIYSNTEEYFVNHDLESKKRQGVATLREIESKLGRRGRFLDIGCGRGELLWAAREEGWEYEGVDPSSTYLQWAREHLGVEGRPGTIEENHFPDELFAAITMGGVIEHLYEPAATLQEVYRILEPGGLLWLDAPNEDALSVRIGNLYMKALGRDWVVALAPTFSPFHVQGFNPRSLTHLLTQSGFVIQSLRIWGGMFPQTGTQTVRKRLEYHAARAVNWMGNHIGSGTYMFLWVQKPAAER